MLRALLESKEKSLSSKKIFPEEGLSNPARICSKDDLPAPETPVIATVSFCSIVKFILFNTFKLSLPILKDLQTSLQIYLFMP